jgi:hypothetical protein
MGEAMSVSSLIREFHVAHKTLAKLLGMNYQLLQTNVPVFLPSSGSIGNNGSLTLTTALDTTYANAYMYFPANAIAAGVAAGLYFVQMSSTTVGTIYNNTYTSGKQSIPSSPTAFVTTGPGAYTQTTGADINLILTTLPGSSLGSNGSLFVFPQEVVSSSANNKIFRLKLDSTTTNTHLGTTIGQSSSPMVVRNKGVQNRNVSNNATGFTTGGTGPVHTTLDTSSDITLTLTANLANASDYAGFAGLLVQINPSN